MKVVFIGDDAAVANFTTTSMLLRWRDLTPLVATRADIGLRMVAEQSPDAVLLHDSGTDQVLCMTVQELRYSSAVPLLVLGDPPDLMRVVTALDLGADDYVQLPCSLPQLIARVWAMVRRCGIRSFDEGASSLVKGDLFTNPTTCEVFLHECVAGSRMAQRPKRTRLAADWSRNIGAGYGAIWGITRVGHFG